MSEQTRYRLTGALFLVALAVILAPMLFDGDGLPKVEVNQLEAASPRQPVQAPQEAFAQPAFDALEEQSASLRDEVDAQGYLKQDGANFGEIALVDPQEPASGVPELGGEGAPVAGAAGASTSTSSRGTTAPTRELAQVWAVQVASFARGDNAQALRDELRSQGYEGFLSTAKRDGEVWTRVLVGPYLDKAEAQRILGSIADKFSVSPQLRTVVQ